LLSIIIGCKDNYYIDKLQYPIVMISHYFTTPIDNGKRLHSVPLVV